MVANAFDGFGDEEQIQAGRDGARVFHHVGDELAHEAVVLAVDQVVGFDDFQRNGHVQPGKGVQRLAQHVGCQRGGNAQLGKRQGAGRARLDDALHHAGDAVGFVAGAFQIGNGARDGDEQAQIARGGLAPPDDGDQLVVDLQLQGIDMRLGIAHGLGCFEVVVRHGLYRLAQLLFDQPAHFHDHAADVIEFRVELGGQMLVWHDVLLLSCWYVARVSRSGR